jgi:hypothetical protein
VTQVHEHEDPFRAPRCQSAPLRDVHHRPAVLGRLRHGERTLGGLVVREKSPF